MWARHPLGPLQAGLCPHGQGWWEHSEDWYQGTDALWGPSRKGSHTGSWCSQACELLRGEARKAPQLSGPPDVCELMEGFRRSREAFRNPPAMQETLVRSPGGEDPLEKGKTTHSSVLAWRIPWVHGVAKSQLRLSELH